ncbi:MAG: TetR/AcrR family transcriptional regulator [Planctomycetia bacterium]|nr:TetR/AcrR family transcriptional regulator [Planctomycetia bacterium]
MKKNSPDDRRKQILKTAMDVFAEKGFRSTDVQEIADRCSVGKGTVYRHFESKENLFWEVGRTIFVYLEQLLEEIQSLSMPALQRVERFVLASCEFLTEYPARIAILAQIRSIPKQLMVESIRQYVQVRFTSPVCEMFREAIIAGEIAEGDPLNYHISVMNAVWGVILLYNADEDSLTLVERVRLTLHLLLHGMVCSREIKQEQGC